MQKFIFEKILSIGVAKFQTFKGFAKVLMLMEWLYEELERTSQEIKEARERKAYTSAAHHEGKADAILRMIKKLKNE